MIALLTYFLLNFFIYIIDDTRHDSPYYVGVNEIPNKIVVFFRYMFFGVFIFRESKREKKFLDWILIQYYQYQIFKSDIKNIIKKELI
jgi:hypothetical protein